MSLPVLSIVAFAIAIIVSCVSQINVGFLSIAFAFIIGVLFLLGGLCARQYYEAEAVAARRWGAAADLQHQT